MTLLLAGCASSVHEVHFLKSTDKKTGLPINYYCVTVDGTTLLSSSRYLSGYFDMRAVETYFSEFSQPKNADDIVKAADKKEDDGTLTPLGDKGKDRSLVMILSSNSDDIATSISALAQSEAITQTLANVIGKDRLDAAATAADNAAYQAQRGKGLAESGKTLVAGLDDAADAKAADDHFLQYANQLVNFLAPGTHFDSLADAKKWLAGHKEDK